MEEQLRRTKIIATLGPATDAPGALLKVLVEGVNVVRLNLSHGSADDHRARALAVRAAAQELAIEVGILADLQGPKIRIEHFAAGPVELVSGAAFTLDCRADAPPGDVTHVGVSYLDLWRDVKPGDVLLLDDGLVSLEVVDVGEARVECVVLAGGRLSDRKGINRLGGGLTVAALSDKDRNDIRLAAELGVDFLAVSFVKTAQDIETARALLREAGGDAALVAKIERAEAIDNLAEIVEAADAVMVARGDLGVEIGDAELPGLQKKIIRDALRGSRIVITATQMMQSMVESPIPTRAEVLDVANAVIDGTDAVMLSQETAAGKHPALAVAAMRRVCLGAERQFLPVEDLDPGTHRLDRADQAIALAAMFLAGQISVRAIVALTESGATAQWLSRFRSTVPIYALSRNAAARRRMLLYRDVNPVDFDARGAGPTQAVRDALAHLFALGHLSAGDRVLVTTGDHTGRLGGTNTLKLLRLGDGGVVEGLSEL
ncbi:MAG: pyruvate kinase [Dokdonella sp.]|uniref:pyruvate kinase n=1 Tax=Dokdonella sp. TaxID=2291710 RepID=UPI0025B8DCBA|nr:pyruvate kinase [Dokdonella sp.]MBZ0221498.1 pyruvate kinase [Dokdonella sp.]MCC7255407.1 pyruvate kinase [Dokdonella sp.]